MKSKRTIQAIGQDFNRELEEIRKIRFSSLDRDLQRPISKARLTDGLVKMPEWNILKEKLINEKRKDKKC